MLIGGRRFDMACLLCTRRVGLDSVLRAECKYTVLKSATARPAAKARKGCRASETAQEIGRTARPLRRLYLAARRAVTLVVRKTRGAAKAPVSRSYGPTTTDGLASVLTQKASTAPGTASTSGATRGGT